MFLLSFEDLFCAGVRGKKSIEGQPRAKKLEDFISQPHCLSIVHVLSETQFIEKNMQN